jgi:osmotically-inducible protein OsmY
MANDRYRDDRNRYREDDGYIARRGFGNERAGYDRGSAGDEDYDRNRERDFGDSAGYGSGGSTRDWRDVVGEDRGRGGPLFDDDYSRGNWGYPRSGSASSRSYGQDRYSSDTFGRGSRDYNEDRGFFERAADEIGSWLGNDEAGRSRSELQAGRHHRGRGPKGYRRSDARILEDVSDRLTEDPHIDASEIEVTVSDCEVTLRGTVGSRFEKRHAEDLAESVAGVTHVQNNLRVQQYADQGMGGSMLSGAGAAGAGSTGQPVRSESTTTRKRAKDTSDR